MTLFSASCKIKQTFMRQKATLVSPLATPNQGKEAKDHGINVGPKAIPDSDGSVHGKSNGKPSECITFYIKRSMISRDITLIVKNAFSGFAGSVDNGDSQHHEMANISESIEKISSAFFSPEDCLGEPNGFDCFMNAKASTKFNNSLSQKIANGSFSQLDMCHLVNRKCVNSSSKVNDNTTGAGALRYALHLRFLCPPPKKSLKLMQRCKSDPSSVPQTTNMGIEDRRFYLYNDLRVVFPQRHSDAEEGKV